MKLKGWCGDEDIYLGGSRLLNNRRNAPEDTHTVPPFDAQLVVGGKKKKKRQKKGQEINGMTIIYSSPWKARNSTKTSSFKVERFANFFDSTAIECSRFWVA